ncbi:MAG: tRNA (N6-isopentenyl adenosine(37)-C2)-methylthiotransferase MiaB, partial [Zetaproteobacteria bacterium CG_4_8_14_3_um_filter_59_5]
LHHAHIGRTEDVLVERASKSEGDMQGRTPDFKIVHFPGTPGQVGQIIPMRITAAYGQSLRGEPVEPA